MSDHERIWLQPNCCTSPYDGRQWCEDNVFECDDGNPAVEYIRADLAAERIAELEAALKERGWQPIKTAPKDSTSILVMNNDEPSSLGGLAETCWAGNTAVAAWWGGEDGWVCFMDMVQDPMLHFEPTHWMPLPEPPKDEIDAQESSDG